MAKRGATAFSQWQLTSLLPLQKHRHFELSVCHSAEQASVSKVQQRKSKLPGAVKSKSCGRGKVTQAVWKLKVHKVRLCVHVTAATQMIFLSYRVKSDFILLRKQKREVRPSYLLLLLFSFPLSVVFSPCQNVGRNTSKGRGTTFFQ